MAQPAILRFGPFQFDTCTGRLAKHGRRIKLQPKSAALLACLLSHHGAVLDRGTLKRALWPEGTHVDFDLGIKVAARKLRDALSNTADDPACIQTIPGESYRFIASVSGEAEARPPEQNGSEASPQWACQPRRSAPRVTGVVGVLTVLAVLASLAMIVRHQQAIPLNFRNRDWVVIAAFENRTGERVLDGSIEYALERELSQSRYLNVVPPDRIGDALTLMRQKTDAVLTPELARQVAIRDGGIRAVVDRLPPTHS